ncbi:MAG: hypothetical protein KAI66_12200 [Lentisphaeria bacterium]|nr:hypothetical protein [Lentisphaeria bacterium]
MNGFVASGLVFTAFFVGARTRADGWRSALYPSSWRPGFASPGGHVLHDVSYAGYARGERRLPDLSDRLRLDVVGALSADNTGKTDTTIVLQTAIDTVSKEGGGIVFLPAGLYRCDGLLSVRASGLVIAGAGAGKTRLLFTRAKGMTGKRHLSFRGSVRRQSKGECLLAEDGRNHSSEVLVADAGALKPGDEVAVGWVISAAFVEEHHMAKHWRVFNGKWQPFFRRTVVAVDRLRSPHAVRLDVPLRYPAKVRDRASLRLETGYLRECGLQDLSVSNAVDWDAAWAGKRVHAVEMEGVKDCWVRNVHSFASGLPGAGLFHLQSGGIYIGGSKRVTVADCRMEKAQHRGGGGCGYLFEISRCSEILTRDCVAAEGRHNFIQNWGFGTSGCVWLRCTSRKGRSLVAKWDPIGLPGHCEYHHSLAMACLVDQCRIEDGWYGGNRRNWSSGGGSTVTQSVYWNTSGGGVIRSWQVGMGYIVGTTRMRVLTGMGADSAPGTGPEDYREGVGKGATLQPQSLYEDQLRRRLERRE